MKKTIFMLPALALMLFAACSSEDAVTKDNTAQLNETPENAIGFNAYLKRTVTRAGAPGILVTSGATTGQVNLRDQGFGVFGYYANGDLYSENATPNFMYNQQVTYDGDWKYEPVKYWPNEFGSSAISTGVDRVTFFAYAPYVGVDPTTGQLTGIYNDTPADANTWTNSGITSLTRNGKTGDPYVRYVGAFSPANCVDLCYGVAAENFTSTIGASDGANNINAGEPYLNVAKPEINSKIYFDFKHALAKLTVQIDADVDIASHNTSDALDNKTRIWVRSITFDGIAQRGYLNLNSGMWYEVMDNNKISHASVTIHDGRRDGAEAIADDSYESPTGFNENLIQNEAYTTTPGTDANEVPTYTAFSTSRAGVTASYQNLFGDATNGSLLVIPANEQLKVTIVYDVETADATLPNYLSDGVTKGSTIENKITKNITLGGTPLKLESGNAYTLNLHLGMTSVKFDAKVSDWDDGGESNVDLPQNSGNALSLGATTSPYNSTDVSIPANATSYSFTVTGLEGNEAVTKTPGGSVTTITCDANATSGSIAVVASFAAANTTTAKKTGTAQIVGSTSSKGVIYNITQEAHALGMTASPLAAGETIITLTPTATGVDWTAATITVKKTPSGDTERTLVAPTNYSVANGSGTPQPGTITLTSAAGHGDKFVISVKSGDAEEETVTVNVP